jgi:CRP/FNR family transcriptional regulator, cyclic AMP receptor protein
MSGNEFTEDNITTIQHLKTIPALESFSEQDLQTFLRFSEIKSYRENEIIIEENSLDDRVFYLISGKAKVVKNGKELIILRRTGDVFGEIGVVTGIARSASVFAMGPTTCLIVRTAQIENLDEKNRLSFKYILYRGFAEILANRLKRTTEELIQARTELSLKK